MNLSMSCSDYRNNVFAGWKQTGRHAGGRLLALHGNPHNTSDYNAHRKVPSAAEKPWEVLRGEGKGKYATLKELAEATGFEAHGLTFVDWDVFRQVPDVDERAGMVTYKEYEMYRPEAFDLRLSDGSPMIDAGCPLPGINDDHTGKAPDLGAYETGQPVPHYGPRPEKEAN
jgi:hypothetical protein